MFVRLRWVGLLSVAVGSSLIWSCGGDSAPAASSTPTPVAVDTATPVPRATAAAATPFPGVGGCNLPPVTHEAKSCETVEANPDLRGSFIKEVDDSIAEVRSDRPDLFAPDGAIKDFGGFRVAMIKRLESKGLCAVPDGEELAIKNTNDYSEQYHPELSNRHVRTGADNFRAVCRPANFPVNPTPLPQRSDCALPSSREFGCTRLDSSQFFNAVDAVQTAIAADRPDLTDGTYALVKQDVYYAEVIKRLRDKGFCAIFDGEELAMKNSNTFNEQFHLVLSNGRLHPGLDRYRGTCEPAAF